MDPNGDVLNNEAAKRFEIEIEGRKAVLTYSLKEGTIDLRHTLVPEELRGKNLAGRLAYAALEAAKAGGLSVIPTCPFVQAYLRKHPEYSELIKTQV